MSPPAMSMRRWVLTTDRGEVWVTLHHSAAQARTLFHKKFPGLTVSSVIEATEF